MQVVDRICDKCLKRYSVVEKSSKYGCEYFYLTPSNMVDRSVTSFPSVYAPEDSGYGEHTTSKRYDLCLNCATKLDEQFRGTI